MNTGLRYVPSGVAGGPVSSYGCSGVGGYICLSGDCDAVFRDVLFFSLFPRFCGGLNNCCLPASSLLFRSALRLWMTVVLCYAGIPQCPGTDDGRLWQSSHSAFPPGVSCLLLQPSGLPDAFSSDISRFRASMSESGSSNISAISSSGYLPRMIASLARSSISSLILSFMTSHIHFLSWFYDGAHSSSGSGKSVGYGAVLPAFPY